MGKCKHARGMKEPWDNEKGWYVTFADGETRLVTTERCWNCKEWLSLGPANDGCPLDDQDTYEAVTIERHAATIIADVMANVEHVTDWQVAIGMAAHDADNDPPTGGLAWMWHAGWLARHIWKEHGRG